MNQDPKTALVINAIPDVEKFEKVIEYFSSLYSIFQNHGATTPLKLRTSEQILGDAGIMRLPLLNSRMKKPSKMLFQAMNSLP